MIKVDQDRSGQVRDLVYRSTDDITKNRDAVTND